MGKLVTITAKIPEELKKQLETSGVNISGFVREALEQETKRLEMKRLHRLAKEAGEILRVIPAEEFIKVIRESREER